jgi:hypothetical protein
MLVLYVCVCVCLSLLYVETKHEMPDQARSTNRNNEIVTVLKSLEPTKSETVLCIPCSAKVCISRHRTPGGTLTCLFAFVV